MNIYTTEQVADILACGVSRVSELIAAKKIRAAKPGRGYVFRQEWIEEYLEREAEERLTNPSYGPPKQRGRYPDLP